MSVVANLLARSVALAVIPTSLFMWNLPNHRLLGFVLFLVLFLKPSIILFVWIERRKMWAERERRKEK